MRIAAPALLCLSCLVFQVPLCLGVTLHVDAAAGPGGDGNAGTPFQTISAALEAAPPDGAVVFIRPGVYPETLDIRKGGTPESPLVLRAEPGARATVSGFEALTGWKDEGGGLFSLSSPEPVDDLFVGSRRQPLARFPDAAAPWLSVIRRDPNSATLGLASLPDVPGEDRSALHAVVYCHAITGEKVYPVAAIDPGAGTISLRTDPGPISAAKGDAVLLYNSESFVTSPGEWSRRRVDGGYRVLFRPRTKSDLQQTRTRVRSHGIRITAAHVRVEGLEIAGASQHGIAAREASDVLVKNCVIYANGSASGSGVTFDRCERATLDSSVVFANSTHGITVIQGDTITLRGCEVAFNDMDGIVFSGRKSEPQRPLQNVRLLSCYIHHHFNLGHPDNTQIYSHVRNVAYEDNLLQFGGQNAMLQECAGLRFTNNVFLGALARHVILGHNSAHHAEFIRNTFAFARHGAMGTAATGVTLMANVFYHNPLSYESDDIRSDGGLFWMKRDIDPSLVHTLGKWKSYVWPQDFAKDHGMEMASAREDPGFKNMPLLQVIGRDTFLSGSPDTLPLDPEDTAAFGEGDTIEINGDGIPRRVLSVDADSVRFAPVLAALPFRAPILWKWAAGASFEPDLASARTGGPGQPGSSIDVAAYRRGELARPGVRSLPVLSDEARSAFPDPAEFVYPFCLTP